MQDEIDIQDDYFFDEPFDRVCEQAAVAFAEVAATFEALRAGDFESAEETLQQIASCVAILHKTMPAATKAAERHDQQKEPRLRRQLRVVGGERS